MGVRVRGWARRLRRASIAQCVRLASPAAALTGLSLDPGVVQAQDTTVAQVAQNDSARRDRATRDTTAGTDSTSMGQRIARLYRRYPWLPVLWAHSSPTPGKTYLRSTPAIAARTA